MTRVKRSVHARKKRRAVLDRAKGYRGEKNSSYRRAKEQLMKSDAYAYRSERVSRPIARFRFTPPRFPRTALPCASGPR